MSTDAVRPVGGLLPGALLDRVAAGGADLKGTAPADYHLRASERLGDAASRAWLDLRGAYQSFRDKFLADGENDPDLEVTREHWLRVLLAALGFDDLPLRRPGLPEDDGKYPVSHQWEHVPVHLIGWNDDLDRRGPRHRRAPQSMLQEFLNVHDEYLWGLLSNGRQLRLLRDSKALTGSAYVEFDLEAIFDGEQYSDFYTLFALLHVSRFELLDREDGGTPTLADCWLERWRIEANELGVRVRDRLRDGVKAALEELGTGFIEANPEIRENLASNRLTADDFRHELLRLAYQLIFLFVAEERGVLADPDAPEEAKDAYRRYFSAGRLRRIARRRPGDQNTDLWRAQAGVLDALGTETPQDDSGAEKRVPLSLRRAQKTQAALGLPGLGGLFFRPEPSDDGPNGSDSQFPDLLRDADLSNARLLAAVRHLDETRDDRGRTARVSYRLLETEELGSIFESLLEIEPVPDVANQRFTLEERAGNLRKTTGSYYTPRALIDTLLDTALDPVLDRAVAAADGDPKALLLLRACDPACGSGAFLVAAAQRIAHRYAVLETGDPEPPPLAVSDAMHEVVRHCVYGVDINPLAVELARVSLWLASQTPGKPLAFLDHHLKVGNSLLGATPALLARQEIPDGAFNPLDGDDPKVAARLRGDNAHQAARQGTFFDVDIVPVPGNEKYAERAREISQRYAPTLAEIREQVRDFRESEADPGLRAAKRAADAWCAAFVWPKYAGGPEPITTKLLRGLLADPGALPPDAEAELDRIASRYQFFHWHLEFPDVFRDVRSGDPARHPDWNPAAGWRGGFDFVLGNPPWERVKLQEQEFFAPRRKEIAEAKTAAIRKRMIERLPLTGDETDRRLFDDFHVALRRSDGISQLLRESGRYRLTGHGDINTYAVFAETSRTVVRPDGRVGLVLPTGIGTDATTAPFFRDVVASDSLAAFLEFENEAFVLSKDVHHSFRFCLLTMTGQAQPESEAEARFAFGLRYIADLGARTIRRPPDDLLLVNPNTGTTPLFRLPDDARITFDIYQRVPVLWRDGPPEENPWGLSFMAMFHMANDSYLFRTEEDLRRDGWELEGNVFTKGGRRMLPLVEAKMIHHFDHRFGTYTGQTEQQANMGTLPRPTPEKKADPSYLTMPRYWVQEFETKNEEKSKKRGKDIYDPGVDARLETRHWDQEWLLGWRDIVRSTDERTIISSLIPKSAVGDKFLLAFTGSSAAVLQANLSSFVLDFCARQKHAGASFKYYLMKQLPVLPPKRFRESAPWEPGSTLAEWIEARVLELTYTAWDMEPFARDLGDDGPPFVWDEARRVQIRAELDAAFFLLYGVARDDVGYIMDTFSYRRKLDEAAHGTYRTKDLILARYDALAAAEGTGEPYRSPLAPPPGQGARAFGDTRSRLRADRD